MKNLTKEAANLLDIRIQKQELNKQDNIIVNSLITVYFDNLNTFIKSEDNKDKKYNTLLSTFKSDLLSNIKDSDKLTNVTFSVFNKVLKNIKPDFIAIFRLLNFEDINKYSKLSKKLQNDICINYSNLDALKVEILDTYKVYTKEQNCINIIKKYNKLENK